MVAKRRPISAVNGAHHVAAIGVLALVWLVEAARTAHDLAHVLRFLVDQPDALSYTAAIQGDAYRISVNLTVVVVVTLLMTLLAVVGRRDLDAIA